MSRMTVRVLESQTPVPDSGGSETVTPGTGVLTVSNTNAGGVAVAGVVSSILLIIIMALVILKRHFNIKIVSGRSRWLAKGLVLIAVVTAAFSFSAMKVRYDDDMVQAADNNMDTLSINTEDIALEVEMANEPVFVATANKVTVATATTKGYVLGAYVTDGDLVTGEGSGKIASLTGNDTKGLGSNTWGIAKTLPSSQNEEVFFGLSDDSDNLTVLKEINEPTLEGDETTLYYGAYVTPELPYGTYTGATINYVAVANFDPYAPVEDNEVGVVYDGSDLSFADGSKENRVVYGDSCKTMYKGEEYNIVKSDNIDDDGVQISSYSVGGVSERVAYPGADAIRIELNYGLGIRSDIYLGGNNESVLYIAETEAIASMGEAFNISGDTLMIAVGLSSPSEPPYDYGFYGKTYPVYNEARDNTSEITVCTPEIVDGTYQETVGERFDHWYIKDRGRVMELGRENEVKAYIDRNKARLAGTILTVYAHNPYKIAFDGNTATAGTMEGVYSDWWDYDSGKVSLQAPNYQKIVDGVSYGFVGWSKNPNATKDSGDKIYGPSENVDISEFEFSRPERKTTLYAIWSAPEGVMQGFDGCETMEIGQVTALTDLRDNNTYTVGKMQDGRCWMMENLRLESENSTNSNMAQGYGGRFVGLAEAEVDTFSTETGNSLYSSANITGGDLRYRIPRYNNNNSRINDESLIALPGGVSINGTRKAGSEGKGYKWYGYGNYYTWHAAMANTNPLAGPDELVGVSTSICPAGWHLPTGYFTNGEYSELDIALGGTGGPERSHANWAVYPNNFVFAGRWVDTRGVMSRGVDGDYWGATVSSSNYGSQYAVITPLSVSEGGPSWNGYLSSFRYSGASVRCVADYE